MNHWDLLPDDLLNHDQWERHDTVVLARNASSHFDAPISKGS